LGAIGVYLVAPVVEPKDALRRVRDGTEVALALTHHRERETQQGMEEECHFLAAVLPIQPSDFRAAHSPSILSSMARKHGSE
jgi:hypothetical protein